MLNVHQVPVRARAKANADFGFLGFCQFPGLVESSTVRDLKQHASSSHYSKIFNHFDDTRSKRAAAKAGELGDSVVQKIFGFLQTCLIAGPDHVLGMARGASFLRSEPWVAKQDTHTDFDFEDFRVPEGFRRSKPFSIWVALYDDTHLWLAGEDVTCNAGDVVVFAGDCAHSGAANLSCEVNYRLFCYVPTREFDVPWDIEQCPTKVKKRAVFVDDVKEKKWLHKVTDPLSVKFDLDAFAQVLYDRSTARFIRFSVDLWLGGLDTAQPTKNPYNQGLPSLSVLACKHCPHFRPEHFRCEMQTERALLNDFRKQCVYCTSVRKPKRSRDEPLG